MIAGESIADVAQRTAVSVILLQRLHPSISRIPAYTELAAEGLWLV